MHIEIKATRKGGNYCLRNIAHALLGWPWEATWGVRAAAITVLVYVLQRMLALQVCIPSCAEASHYGNFGHANSIMDHHNPDIASMFVVMKGGLYRIQ